MKNFKIKAVFLDRDGVMNEDRGYINSKSDFKWLKGTKKAIKFLKKNNYLVIVITNQSGVGKGLIKVSQLKLLHRWMNKELLKHGGWVDDFIYCPYHPDAKIKKYKKKSYFRKPNPGMILKAIDKYSISIKDSFMIGDKSTDKLAAKRAGVKFFYREKDLYFQLKKIIY